MNPPAITRPGPPSGPPSASAGAGTRWLASLLLGLWLATAPGLGTAEAAPDDADPATAAPEPARDDRAAGEDLPDAGEESPDVFVPSEDISEDFAVSFPVDI